MLTATHLLNIILTTLKQQKHAPNFPEFFYFIIYYLVRLFLVFTRAARLAINATLPIF